MKKVVAIVSSFCFFCCAPQLDAGVKSVNIEPPKKETPKRSVTREDADAYIAGISERLTVYNEWWDKVYESDSLLYQGITQCMNPSEVVVSLGAVSKNVVRTYTIGLSKDGKSHIFYSGKHKSMHPPSSFVEKDSSDGISFFLSEFAFVFDGDSLIGVRPQWLKGHGTPEYKKHLSDCAAKYGVNVLEAISEAEFDQREFDSYFENKE